MQHYNTVPPDTIAPLTAQLAITSSSIINRHLATGAGSRPRPKWCRYRAVIRRPTGVSKHRHGPDVLYVCQAVNDAAIYATPTHHVVMFTLSSTAQWVGKWVPASAGKAKAGMVHSVSGWTRGVQVKLWDPLRTCDIPEHLRGLFTTRRYTNTRLPLPFVL